MKNKTFIIAEIGVNHNGSLEKSYQLIDAMNSAGADAVKFQSWVPEKLASEEVSKANYQKANDGDNGSQLDMLKKLELKREYHAPLKEYAETKGLSFLSSVFDFDDSKFLSNLGCNIVKIGSGEVTNIPLLYLTAQLNLDVILSTGMSSYEDINLALGTLAFGYSNIDNSKQPSLKTFEDSFQNKLYKKFCDKISLLQCTSDYPCLEKDVHLNVIDSYKDLYGLEVGFSDHTAGIHIPLAAVGKGATIIEKHVTLDRNLPGPDHKSSLEPEEFKIMCKQIRSVENALGEKNKFLTNPEKHTKSIVQKVIVASSNIQKGEKFNNNNIATLRTGSIGIEPKFYWQLIGKVANKDYSYHEIIDNSQLS